MGLLFVAAAAVRFPYLWTIPQFTDETFDSLKSFSIYQGQQLPLYARESYIGALQNYLEAAAFFLAGGSLYAPRAVVWLLGSFTVVATYLLAREMLGRPRAWLAAALMATSGVHVAGNSHVAYSHSTTPLYVALGMMLLYRAVHRQSGPSLAGAGFACGLALQTHPTVVAFLPGAAAYLLWKGRALLHGRWPYLTVCAFLIAYSNMIAYNLTSGFGSFGGNRFSNPSTWDLTNPKHEAVIEALLRLPAGAVDARPDSGSFLGDPLVVAYAGLVIVGFALLGRVGNPLPWLVTVSVLVIFPFFKADSSALDIPPHYGRFLAPLLPLLVAGLSAGAWPLAVAVGRRLRGPASPHRVRHGLILLSATLFLVPPLASLSRYYSQSFEQGRTNDRFFQVLTTVESARTGGETVLLDAGLSREQLGGGGSAARALRYLLTMRGIPYEDWVPEPETLVGRPDAELLLVLTRQTSRSIGAELPLIPVAGQDSSGGRLPYGVYRLTWSG